MAIPPDPGAVGEGPVDRLSQANSHVFGGVMSVDVQITRAGYREIHHGMASEELEHMIEKANPRGELGMALAVQIKGEPNFGLARFARNLGAA
jgi:hypothetical protein